MICLPSTDKLQITVSSGTAIKWTVTYVVKSTGVISSSRGSSNGTNDVDIVPAPASGDFHLVKQITAHNTDSTTRTITIKIDGGGSPYILYKVAIPQDVTLFYSPETGFNILPDTGAVELDRVEQTSGGDIITESPTYNASVIMTSNSITFSKNTTIDIDVYIPQMQTGGQNNRGVHVYLWEDTTCLGHVGYGFKPEESPTPPRLYIGCVRGVRRTVASAGSHIYRVTGCVNDAWGPGGDTSDPGSWFAGNGTSGNYSPAVLSIKRVL